jgi:uncharacterized protein
MLSQANEEARVAKPKDVDSYIANSASEARPILEELRKIIKSTVPEVEEGISWGVPFYRYQGALAGFAAYKNHVSFGVGVDVLQGNDRETLEKNGYKTGKKTIQIRFGQEVPATAIEQILRAIAQTNEAQTAACL